MAGIYVFDEDSASGTTLRVARQYFTTILGRNVEVATNMDIRTELNKGNIEFRIQRK